MQAIKQPVPSASVGSNMTSSQSLVGGTDTLASAAVQSSAALSSNLSELDNLLQELSSAQFAVEIDRRSSGSDFLNVTAAWGQKFRSWRL